MKCKMKHKPILTMKEKVICDKCHHCKVVHKMSKSYIEVKECKPHSWWHGTLFHYHHHHHNGWGDGGDYGEGDYVDGDFGDGMNGGGGFGGNGFGGR